MQAEQDDLTITEVAFKLDRSYNAVACRAHKLRNGTAGTTQRQITASARGKERWKPHENGIVLSRHLSLDEVAEILGRSRSAVYQRRLQLGMLTGHNHGGEHNGRAKLTETAVLEIRARAGTLSQRRLAEIYGIGQAQISEIVRRLSWAHI